MSKKLSGISAPISTPFVNGEVSYNQLKSNMQKYSETALAGFFALGSNGESMFLTESEKLKVLEMVLQEKADHQIVMAGAGYESTRQTISFSNQVAEMGADFVSILTPSYFKKRLTDDAMIGYYTDVADSVPIPVVAYNAPGFTGMTLTPQVVEVISRHPNVIGMKDTSKGNMSNYLSVSGENFDILSGTVSTLFESMLLGAKGGVVSLANAFPAPCCELYEACKAVDLDKARRLHYMLIKLNKSVSASFGVAGVKYAAEVAGYHGGDPRKPLLPITEESRQIIKKAIEEAGVL
ncbi:MAG: dihydrodipicolinate synthase family protein [Deltaproteobacteria bacterium]|jgi:4-hydroxy-2-oxoglutarate aldolase|nr:dihydrodipicolinate synthase family protein [Deltaproteobacteria bacterium]